MLVVKSWMTVYAWVYSWAMYSILLVYVVFIFMLVHTVLVTIDLQYSWKSGSVKPSTLFFFLKIALAIFFHSSMQIS
jgi:hypothetical protein